jgi:asparagine synthase (glutamine-hydrolysing)
LSFFLTESNEVIQNLRDAAFSAVSKTLTKPYALVAFSGGVDSSVLAVICRDLGKETTLLTVGFQNSPDLKFSVDIARSLGLKIITRELETSTLRSDFEYVKRGVKVDGIAHLEDCLAFYYVSKVASQLGFDHVLSANGPDELFCGYYRFAQIMDEKGPIGVQEEIKASLQSAYRLSNETEKMGLVFRVKVLAPFLSPDFVRVSLEIPVSEKLNSGRDGMRKWAWRKMALMVGVPREAAMKPKKAIQYSTGLHLNMKRIYRN